jgi:DNA-binding NarL/FixJ family response regulator
MFLGMYIYQTPGEPLFPGHLRESLFGTALALLSKEDFVGQEGNVRKNILVVDDSDVMRAILRERLGQNKDWTIDAESASGAQAVDRAKELRPDLAVLDFAMTSMDGLELATELKRINPAMSIVLLTAFKDESLDERAHRAGVTWVLSKRDGVEKVYDFARILLRTDCPNHVRGTPWAR